MNDVISLLKYKYILILHVKLFLVSERHLLSFYLLQNLSIDTDLHAANGKRVKALDIFAYALAFFKEQALKVCLTPMIIQNAMLNPVNSHHVNVLYCLKV